MLCEACLRDRRDEIGYYTRWTSRKLGILLCIPFGEQTVCRDCYEQLILFSDAVAMAYERMGVRH